MINRIISYIESRQEETRVDKNRQKEIEEDKSRQEQKGGEGKR